MVKTSTNSARMLCPPTGGVSTLPRVAGQRFRVVPAFFPNGVCMADNTTRIADIDEILRSGATSITNDGTTVQYDFEQLRKERGLLVDDDDTLGPLKRPRLFQVDLSGFH